MLASVGDAVERHKRRSCIGHRCVRWVACCLLVLELCVTKGSQEHDFLWRRSEAHLPEQDAQSSAGHLTQICQDIAQLGLSFGKIRSVSARSWPSSASVGRTRAESRRLGQLESNRGPRSPPGSPGVTFRGVRRAKVRLLSANQFCLPPLDEVGGPGRGGRTLGEEHQVSTGGTRPRGIRCTSYCGCLPQLALVPGAGGRGGKARGVTGGSMFPSSLLA